jgi:hypothetical protein
MSSAKDLASPDIIRAHAPTVNQLFGVVTMRRTRLLSAFITSVSLIAGPALAQGITFEGATVSGASRILDLDGANAQGPSLVDYAGYDWLGMAVSKPLVSVNRPQVITGVTTEEDEGKLVNIYSTSTVDTGFHRSIVSGDTVAFTQAFGSSSAFASISARPNDQNFNFFNSYLTSAYRENINVSVLGKRDGATVYSRDLVVGTAGPVLYDFGFLDIDSIEFLTSGGTFLYPNGTTVGSYLNASNAFSAPVLVFDSMSIAAVPEPESFAMLLAGMAMVGAAVRRRRFATKQA